MVHVYYDKIFYLNSFFTNAGAGVSTGYVGGATRMYKFYVKCKGKK